MRKKVYLPRWQMKFVPPLMAVIWLFVTYKNFWSGAEPEMSTVEYALMTLILLGAGFMVWLMASGRLPAYVIEDESKEE